MSEPNNGGQIGSQHFEALVGSLQPNPARGDLSASDFASNRPPALPRRGEVNTAQVMDQLIRDMTGGTSSEEGATADPGLFNEFREGFNRGASAA